MSKGSAIVSMLFTFVMGLLIGHLVSGGGSEGEESADLDADVGAAFAEGEGPERFYVPVTASQPSKGPKDAPVTIVEFSEFQCPYCSRVLPTVKRIEKEYGKKVRFVWRNNPLPFHQNAEPAAIAATEAFKQGGDKMFWKMHDVLFANQKQLGRAELEKYGKQVGMNVDKLKKALDAKAHVKDIKADQSLAQSLGARGTPGFFINGRSLRGAQPFDRFKAVIDEELKTAAQVQKKGVPASQLYAAIIKNGLKEAPKPKAKEQPKRRRPDPNAVYKVAVGNSPQKGKKDALVTIVEFSDFECPFCKRVEPTVDKVVEAYGKDVRVVWKNNPLPFHKNAMPAAEAASEAAAQGKFWQMHKALFENPRALARADLEKHAKAIGLNMARFKKALDSNKHKAAVEADQQIARSLGASGTPSFFINGRNLRGAQPFESFKRVIDEELAKAKKLVAAGTPKGKIYGVLTKDGATSPKFLDPEPAGKAQAPPAANKKYDIPAAKDRPSKGPKKAKVVIQEFSDFQCPFCGRVLPTMKQIMDEYGDKVQLIWRNYPLPFHKEAMPAAQASYEVYKQAGSKKFWAYHDKLFANQRALSRADLEKYAQELGGINMGRFKAALDNETHKSVVQADMDAVTKAGARIGTPSFFINGVLLQGAQPYPAFKQAIEAALKK